MKRFIFLLAVLFLFFGSNFSLSGQTQNVEEDIKIDTTEINKEVKYDEDIKRIKEMLESEEYTCILIVEQGASFEGGMEYFYKLVNNQMLFSETMQEGRVFIQFVVEKTGKVTNAKVVKGLSEENDKEALRIMNLISENYNWKPAEQLGKKVKVRMNIPILFKRTKKIEANVYSIEIGFRKLDVKIRY